MRKNIPCIICTMVTTMLSQKGQKLLIIDNFKFSKAFKSKCGKIRWRCILRSCNSKIYTTSDEKTIIEANIHHNHEADPTLNRQVVSNSIKRKAVEDLTERPTKILHAELGSDLTNQIESRDLDCIRRNIYIARKRHCPPLPTNQKERPQKSPPKTSTEEEFLNALDIVEIVYTNLVPAATMSSGKTYETLAITVPKPYVYQVELNRPNKLNAFNRTMWHEIGKCFDDLAVDENCRSIVVTGSGKLFTAGIDLTDMMSLGTELADKEDIARRGKILSVFIKNYQDSLTALEKCNKPVIAAIHGACIGAGMDMITAADIRYCSKDAWFQVTEVSIGMAADVGTLQRLPKVIGSDSLVRELCYTGRKMPSDEALGCGLISKLFENKESLVQGAIELAAQIAAKSPVAVQGTKFNLVYSRDHTVQDGLDHIANHNKCMLQSEDFANAVMAQVSKSEVQFSKL